jgi:predicted molibdopterin-dependent oxidoreductase YjgC
MQERVEIVVDGERLRVSEGMTLAAALMDAGVSAFRVSVSGAPRAPICGMGSCFECRVTVDGRPHQRSCLIPCREGMVVETGSGKGS